jgi:hypothetical protein
MSAGSRKKHSNGHKQYQGGTQDHLEVESLLAGAGNGRDIEERLNAGLKATEVLDLSAEQRLDKAIDGATNLPTNEQGQVNADDLVKAGNELNAALKEVARRPEAGPAPAAEGVAWVKKDAPEDGVMGGVPGFGIGNEGPVTAGNADTEKQPEGLTPRKVYEGRNIVAVVVRGVRDALFTAKFNAELKDLIEFQSFRIKGLRTGFKVGDISKTQVRVIQADSQVQLSWLEREGRHIDTLMHQWGDRYNDYLLDAEQAKDNRAYKAKIAQEDVTIDVVFFEPDPQHRTVLAAWKGVNLYPALYLGLDSMRDTNGCAYGDQAVSAHFAGTYVRGSNVMEEAQKLLDGIACPVAEC